MRMMKPAGKQSPVLRSIAAASMLCLLVGSVSVSDAAPETATTTTTTTTSTTTSSAPQSLGEVLALRTASKEERYKKLDATKLHRIDWRVTGSGCAACLGRIRKRIGKLNGVAEVAVAIKPPYGVAVIYDVSKVSMEEILKTGIKDETIKIEFVNPVDTKIDKPPFILVPRDSALEKSGGTAGGTATPGH